MRWKLIRMLYAKNKNNTIARYEEYISGDVLAIFYLKLIS